MQSSVADVESYLKVRAEASRLRELWLNTLVGYEESVRYGMPRYTRKGAAEPEIAFASQKNHISLYVLKQEAMQANRAMLNASLGKGCNPYSKPAKIDFEVVKKMLLESYGSQGEIC